MNFNTNLVVQEPIPECELVGNDGNAFSIMAYVSRSLRKAGHSVDYTKDVQGEMMSGDYDHLLCVAMEVCDVQ